jgi:hypothetical protein
MKNPAAVALGRRGGQSTSDKKRAAAQENRREGGRPPKIHTLKVPCPFPNCKVTNGHEHIS